jgi:hypothetical protein
VFAGVCTDTPHPDSSRWWYWIRRWHYHSFGVPGCAPGEAERFLSLLSQY